MNRFAEERETPSRSELFLTFAVCCLAPRARLKGNGIRFMQMQTASERTNEQFNLHIFKVLRCLREYNWWQWCSRSHELSEINTSDVYEAISPPQFRLRQPAQARNTQFDKIRPTIRVHRFCALVSGQILIFLPGVWMPRFVLLVFFFAGMQIWGYTMAGAFHEPRMRKGNTQTGRRSFWRRSVVKTKELSRRGAQRQEGDWRRTAPQVRMDQQISYFCLPPPTLHTHIMRSGSFWRRKVAEWNETKSDGPTVTSFRDPKELKAKFLELREMVESTLADLKAEQWPRSSSVGSTKRIWPKYLACRMPEMIWRQQWARGFWAQRLLLPTRTSNQAPTAPTSKRFTFASAKAAFSASPLYSTRSSAPYTVHTNTRDVMIPSLFISLEFRFTQF